MDSCKMIVLALCVISAFHAPFSNALPRMTNQLSAVHVAGRTANENVCKNYMEGCVPWEVTCCSNMECMNLARGYCLYPLEKCVCQKITVDFY